MSNKSERNYLVEIWFPIEKDIDGYPASKSSEQLLAKPTDNKHEFQISSVPFYLKNVSLGDIVRARVIRVDRGNIFEFEEVVTRGGHNTYRLLLTNKRSDDPEFTINELVDKGLAVEEHHGNFLAVDVPPSVDQAAVDEYLVRESASGRWEMQDGYLGGEGGLSSQQ